MVDVQVSDAKISLVFQFSISGQDCGPKELHVYLVCAVCSHSFAVKPAHSLFSLF